jgi:DNA polymerase III sliding clamp (beta) subunit (PCNA family)
MKIDRKKFVEVLEKVSPALGTNVLVPEYQYFQIDGDHIQASDGVLVIDSVFPIDTGLKCSIPKGVLSLLLSLSTEEVDLVVEDSKLGVKTNKLEGEFAVLSPPKFQILTPIEVEGMELVDPNLIDDVVEGLGFCRFVASKDMASGPNCGVRISADTIFSTDRYRVMKWNLTGDAGIICTVPIKFIDLLKKNQSRISKLGCVENKSLVALLDDGTYTSTCLLKGEYPNLLAYFPDSVDYRQVEFGGSLASAIDRHLVLLKDVNPGDREMAIEIKNEVCTLTSEVPEKSNLVEHIDVKMEKDSEISFSANPTFLQEISSKCSSFKYFDSGLILFETDKFQFLMRAIIVPSSKKEV